MIENQLVIATADGRVQTERIFDGCILGRSGQSCNIEISSTIVSAQHGIFVYRGSSVYYTDLGSTNGTIINGENVRGALGVPGREVLLRDGTVISIAPNDNQNKIFMMYSSNSGRYSWRYFPVRLGTTVTIGRFPENSIVIPDISCSRHHAQIISDEKGLYLRDLGSVNGTFVDSSRISGRLPLRAGQVIKIASSKFLVVDGGILYAVSANVSFDSDEHGFNGEVAGNTTSKTQKRVRHKGMGVDAGVSIEVLNVSRTVKCKAGTGINGGNTKKILDDISLSIKPGELVAILGGSGAGKTTFMNSLTGFEPATEGTVLIDGIELISNGNLRNENYNGLKARMGYVPQQDIVHENLTLYDMLMYTGKLRLSRDTTSTEMETRVSDVIASLDLTQQRDTMIRQLSGGQKKRASIAVELISDPQLMFLDEPTSGLDPEAETNLMNCLRKVSDERSKTIIVITHTLQNIDLFDRVIFLAPGGKLCFSGSPEEARRFFEVGNLTEAYGKISADIPGYVAKYNSYAGGSK